MSDDLADAAQRICGARPKDIRRFSGGDISGASLLTFADGTRMVGKSGPVVAIEARMLEAMAQGTAPVPAVIGYDERHLLIEYLPDDGSLSGTAWFSLAEALTALHALQGDSFGWDEDYALRQVAVENERTASWPEFWAERRLRCHIPELSPALASRVDALSDHLSEILPANPTPSLVHGDLWGGNVLVSQGTISGMIDPCAYYGDREIDAASLTVFNSPPDEFFDALQLEPGWEDRQPVYRLWMWLIHVRLFGESYRTAVERELDRLGF